MSHVEGFPDRDGIDKMVKLAKALCRTVQLFSALIMKKYPDNTTIQTLLTAINVVCALIPEVEGEFLIDTGLNEDALEDPADIPGIDPGKPAAPVGDIT